MSAARPKIADYPFTTLVPNLGVVQGDEHNFVVADIPGLIEGAHQGKGLGHEFLRHIERTALIVHVVDMTGGYEGRDPVEDYRIINNELAMYADELAQRPRIVVANKVDVPGTEDAVRRLKEEVRKDAIAAANGNEFADGVDEASRVFEISALTGKGVDSLIHAIADKVFELRSAAKKPRRVRSSTTRCGSISANSATANILCANFPMASSVWKACRSSAWLCKPTGKTTRRCRSCSIASIAWAWKRNCSRRAQ